MSINYDKDTWDILDTYFKSNEDFLIKHHIDSYHDFVFKKIPYTIKTLNPFVNIKMNGSKLLYKVETYIGGENGDEIFINKPTIFENNESSPLTPNDARLRNFSYMSDIYANIHVKYSKSGGDDDITVKKFNNVKIGSIPIMLHSKLCYLYEQKPVVKRTFGECPFDKGGYFIIDGKEKVIIAQERIATNRLQISKSKEEEYTYNAMIRCTSEDDLFPKTIYFDIYSDMLYKGAIAKN